MKKVNKFLKILVMVIGLAMPFAVYGQSSSKLYQKGESLMQSGEYSDAINAFSAAMKIDGSLTTSCKAKIRLCQKKIAQKYRAKASTSNSSPLSNSSGLKIDKHHVEFSCGTSNPVQIKVDSKSGDWDISSGESWCHAYKTDGDKIASIECDINESVSERNTIVTISDGVYGEKIEVKQAGQQPYIKIDKESVEIPKDGGEAKIDVYSNTEWEITQFPDWCTIVSTDDNSIILRVGKSKDERQAVLTVRTKVGGETYSIIIVQRKVKSGKSFFGIKY